MHEWLEAARDRIASAAALDPSDLELTESDAESLLALARVAAHESGDRRNAPLACYLVGLALARRPEQDVAGIVRQASGRPA